MTIEYKDSKRITALSTDVSYNIVTINHRLSTTDDSAYSDLGSTLSNTSWVMRYKMVISGLSSTNVNPNNSYLFAISKTTTNNQSDQALGLKIQIGGVSTNSFKVSGGTSSQSSGEGYNGANFSTSVSNSTFYVESIRNGSSFSVRLTTNSDYTGGEIQTWSTSGTVEDLRYIKYTNRDDHTSSHVLVSTISDIKIYDGVTSVSGTFVRDGTWTTSASNKVTVEVENTKPSNVQDNSLLVEKDTARRYWFDEALAPTFEDDFSSDNWTDNDSTNIGVSGGALTWSMKRDNTNDASVRDLTSTSDNWVLRFKVTQGSSIGSTGAGNGFFFGISDSDQSVAQNGNQDFVGMAYYYDNQSEYNAMDCDGASLPHLYQGDAGQNFNITANDVFYFEIIKNGSSYTVEGFTNSDYSTGSLGQISGTTTATGLRYLKIMNELSNGSISTSTSPFNGTIDDVEFYNGVTTVTPATWLLGKSHISKSGCLIYYNFEQTSGNLINQATTANGFADGLGSTGDGTSSGTVGKSNTGKVGSNAWSFDGSSGKTASSNSSDLILTGDVSWVGWIKIDSSTSTGAPTIFSVRGAAGNAQVDNALFCGYVSKNTSPIDLIVFHEHDAGTNVSPAVNINTNLSTGVWYHFAVTRDVSEKQYSVYIDGSLLSTHTYNTNPNTTATSLDFELGHTDADDYFDGMLDEVSLWNRVLTADEISALYNSGYGVII